MKKNIVIPCMGCEKLLGQLCTLAILHLKRANPSKITLEPSISQIAAGEYKESILGDNTIALNGCAIQCVNKILNQRKIKPNLIISIPKIIKDIKLPQKGQATLDYQDHEAVKSISNQILSQIEVFLEKSQNMETKPENKVEFNPEYSQFLEAEFSKFHFKVPVNDKNLFFNWNEAWAYHIGEGKFFIGITDYLQTKLADILICELPKIGDKIDQFEAVANIESSKTVNEVLTPFSGEVLAVNHELEEYPEWINEDPYLKGWIVLVKCPNYKEEIDDLMNPYQYFEFLEEKIKEEGLQY
ncbi:MAG: hypothetical protein DRO88_01270 [Promethearchaeia archaeon]|nr:MAG: hypothetical protein DRO88_01270 [Candidatus Lokiarchaeia archaeon]